VVPPGQIARSAVANLVTYTDGSSLSPPLFCPQGAHQMSCPVLGLPLCCPVAMESQQADLLVRILSGGQSDRYYPVWTYLGPD